MLQTDAAGTAGFTVPGQQGDGLKSSPPLSGCFEALRQLGQPDSRLCVSGSGPKTKRNYEIV